MAERILVKTSDGQELSVRVSGSGDPILVVHGWMMSGAVWDSMFLSLDLQGRKFIVPDQRGTGASSRTGTDYSLAQHASDLIAVLDATETKSAIVLGHSMGGQLALYLAAHYPERVRAVMALNPVPPAGLPLPPMRPVSSVRAQAIEASKASSSGSHASRSQRTRKIASSTSRVPCPPPRLRARSMPGSQAASPTR